MEFYQPETLPPARRDQDDRIPRSNHSTQAGRQHGCEPAANPNATTSRYTPAPLWSRLVPCDTRRLTLAIWNGWPQTPPYGGRYSEIVPHLTVAQVGDERLCNGIAVKFALAARDQLPIKARATKVALLVKYGGKWGVQTEFALY